MAVRVGVFVCECGPNIKDNLHFDDVVAYAKTLRHVAHVQSARLFCSEEDQELMAVDIREQQLDRVVFAGCSPREHEATFRKVLQRAALNPYYLQVANIREQCAWVIKDIDEATAHAKKIIEAAVERVVHHEPLEAKSMALCPDVLVVGAGVGGLSAALTLAQKTRKVYLVEKSPAIGGRMVRFGELAPGLECSSCMLEPAMDQVLHHDRIELFTYSTVESIVGYFGNFTVKVRKQARYIDEQACIGCAACIEPCPIRVPNEYNNGLDQRAAIYNPFRGALPNIPLIDTKSCLRFTTGEECTVCAQSCPFAAVKYDDADQVREFNVGAVVLATGAELFDLRQAPQYGYGVIPDVYTHLDLEYLLNTSGPTAGKVALRNGEPPQKIAILHCVGSRSEIFNRHCSGTCCLTSLKIAHLLKKQFPDASISELYTDFSLPDKKAQEFLRKLQNEDKIQFIRVPSMDHVRVESAGGKIALRGAELEKIGGAFSDFDMVVLSVGLVGGVDNRRLASLFDVACDEHSFIGQANSKLDPASTATQGINLAGCVEWPKNVDATVAQAQAAAGKILSRLVPGETLELDPCVAFVNEEACSGCKMCLSVCSYRAIDWKEQVSRAVVSGVLCKGCGVCAACCPSGAIESFHFTDKQILAEVQAFLASPLEDSVWIR